MRTPVPPPPPAHIPPELLPREVDYVIEVPRGGFVKRDAAGNLDLISPLPSPFNYGSAPAFVAPDGEGADVIVLGPRLRRGATGRLPLVARVRFRDAGVDDHKWVLCESPPSEEDLALLDRFFSIYALGKLALRRWRGDKAEARYAGIELVVGGRVIRAHTGGTARARFRDRRE